MRDLLDAATRHGAFLLTVTATSDHLIISAVSEKSSVLENSTFAIDNKFDMA